MTSIEIVNAINNAIAKGWSVHVGKDCKHSEQLRGAIIRNGRATLITDYVERGFDPKKRIFAAKRAWIEVDSIYEPPNDASVDLSQDLNESVV